MVIEQHVNVKHVHLLPAKYAWANIKSVNVVTMFDERQTCNGHRLTTIQYQSMHTKTNTLDQQEW